MSFERILRLKSDFIRIFTLMVLTGVILYMLDESNMVVFQATLIGVFMVGGTHLTRRILFPRLDLQLIAQKAVDGSVAAAIVFASVMVFLIAVMHLPLLVLK